MSKDTINDWYKLVLEIMTGLIVLLYIFTYIYTVKKLDPEYLRLLSTARTLLLASILIYFYNPLRKSFDYGSSMPFFAFSAGISLIFLLNREDILHLVQFILYWDIGLVNSAGAKESLKKT